MKCLNHTVLYCNTLGAFGSSTSDASTSQATSSVVTPRKELLSGHQDSTNGVLHDEKVVSEICAMGFKRDDVIQELTVAKGDKNRAIGALFAKSFVVPKWAGSISSHAIIHYSAML